MLVEISPSLGCTVSSIVLIDMQKVFKTVAGRGRILCCRFRSQFPHSHIQIPINRHASWFTCPSSSLSMYKPMPVATRQYHLGYYLFKSTTIHTPLDCSTSGTGRITRTIWFCKANRLKLWYVTMPPIVQVPSWPYNNQQSHSGNCHPCFRRCHKWSYQIPSNYGIKITTETKMA